jgi:hypothetical protein
MHFSQTAAVLTSNIYGIRATRAVLRLRAYCDAYHSSLVLSTLAESTKLGLPHHIMTQRHAPSPSCPLLLVLCRLVPQRASDLEAQPLYPLRQQQRQQQWRLTAHSHLHTPSCPQQQQQQPRLALAWLGSGNDSSSNDGGSSDGSSSRRLAVRCRLNANTPAAMVVRAGSGHH